MTPASGQDTHPAYGIWEVWQGKPPPLDIDSREDDDYYHRYGVFQGYIDDIAISLQSGSRERYPLFYFRTAPEGSVVEELDVNIATEELEMTIVRVELASGEELSSTPKAAGPFFEGRPVVADILDDSMFRGVRLTPLNSEYGPNKLERKRALEAVLSKLTEADIELLEHQGLKRFSYWV
jgi:hypothetical protein